MIQCNQVKDQPNPFLNSMILVIEKQTIPQLTDKNKEITQADVKNWPTVKCFNFKGIWKNLNEKTDCTEIKRRRNLTSKLKER